jgi:hypothetical protein
LLIACLYPLKTYKLILLSSGSLNGTFDCSFNGSLGAAFFGVTEALSRKNLPSQKKVG